MIQAALRCRQRARSSGNVNGARLRSLGRVRPQVTNRCPQAHAQRLSRAHGLGQQEAILYARQGTRGHRLEVGISAQETPVAQAPQSTIDALPPELESSGQDIPRGGIGIGQCRCQGADGAAAAELARHEAELPFPLIADPERALYRRLGVERRLRSVLNPRALRAAIAGLAAALGNHSPKRGPLGPVKPTGGRLELPADFLIAPDGRITALKYGRHAYDQWTVDELLDHARPASA
jgi:hypothetical protein